MAGCLTRDSARSWWRWRIHSSTRTLPPIRFRHMQKHSIAGFRLSPQQRRLWLAGQTGSAYRTQCALLIEGPLSQESFRENVRNVDLQNLLAERSFD